MTLLWIILAAHLVFAALAPEVARRAGGRVFVFCAVAPALALVWLGAHAGEVLDGETLTTSFSWVEGLGVEMSLRVDAFALLWIGIVSGIGVAVFVYSAGYFGDGPGVGRTAATLTCFSAAMLGVVLADNLLLLYVFWELTSVTSYLLIGSDGSDTAARQAARQALVVTASGGLAMLAGFVLIGQEAGTFELSELAASPPAGSQVAVGAVLVLLGAFTKSAQVPFQGWLPAAMAAPTPVSAYLHSATMVKAGVYLIARLTPLFAVGVAAWRPTVVTVGLVTMFVGAWVALRQHDLKLLLAHGTVSQLGLLVVLFGIGDATLTIAAVGMLVAHALFKSTLFLTVGIIDKTTGTRDIRRLTALGRKAPLLTLVGALAVASMMGAPPLLGFVGKEKGLDGLLHDPFDGATLVVIGVVAASALTVAYSARFLWGAFAGDAPPDPDRRSDRAGSLMMAPAAVLAFAGLGAGIVISPLNEVFAPAAASLVPAAASKELALWAGFNLALGLSALVLGAGALLFLLRDPFARLQSLASVGATWSQAFERILVGLGGFAVRVTSIVQNGSLPIYLAVIVLVVLGTPLIALGASGMSTPDDLVLAESALQTAVAAITIGGALAAALITRRFVAALALGAVGYGTSVLFIIQGAPDLALTQFLVETLTVVALVLVLRHLPEQFPGVRWRFGRVVRIMVSGAAGAAVVLLALTSRAERTAAPVSDVHLASALPDGGGRNVVNVILTDIRALDTFGEIVVVTVAALGVMNLVAAWRRRDASTDES